MSSREEREMLEAGVKRLHAEQPDLSYRDIADIVGKSPSTVSDILNGKRSKKKRSRSKSNSNAYTCARDNIEECDVQSASISEQKIEHVERSSLGEMAISDAQVIRGHLRERYAATASISDEERREWARVQYLREWRQIVTLIGRWGGLDEPAPEPVATSPLDVFGVEMREYQDREDKQ